MDLPANIGASNIFKYNQQTVSLLFELANKEEFSLDIILLVSAKLIQEFIYYFKHQIHLFN